MTPGVLCDTSVLIPALVAWHPDHESSRDLLKGEVQFVAAHVLVECYSVLTRLPSPHRVSAEDAARVLGALSLKPVSLPASRHLGVVASLAARGVRGSAVYDGLVASTASHHGLRLVTRDRRARVTYDAVGVGYTLL